MAEPKKSLSDQGAYLIETIKSLWLPVAGDYFAATGDVLLAAACKTVTGVWSAIDAATQKRLNEFVDLLRDGNLSEEDVRTEDYRSALQRTFYYWMSERREEKRAIIRKIFLGFTNSADKSQYRIERYYRVLDNLEPDDIIVLGRLKQMIIDPQSEMIQKEYQEQLRQFELDKISPEIYRVGRIRNGFDFQENVASKAAKGFAEELDNLIREGIIKKPVKEVSNLPTFQDPPRYNKYLITMFGIEFCEFIESEDY